MKHEKLNFTIFWNDNLQIWRGGRGRIEISLITENIHKDITHNFCSNNFSIETLRLEIETFFGKDGPLEKRSLKKWNPSRFFSKYVLDYDSIVKSLLTFRSHGRLFVLFALLLHCMFQHFTRILAYGTWRDHYGGYSKLKKFFPKNQSACTRKKISEIIKPLVRRNNARN